MQDPAPRPRVSPTPRPSTPLRATGHRSRTTRPLAAISLFRHSSSSLHNGELLRLIPWANRGNPKKTKLQRIRRFFHWQNIRQCRIVCMVWKSSKPRHSLDAAMSCSMTNSSSRSKSIWCCIPPRVISFPAEAACERFAGRARGGARVIYYFRSKTNRLFLIFGYRKNECEDLTQAQVRSLARIIEQL